MASETTAANPELLQEQVATSSMKLLDQRYAEYDEQAIRVVTRYDIGLLHPEAVVVLTESRS